MNTDWISWLGFFLFLSVLTVSVTYCTVQVEPLQKNDYQKCLTSCPKTFGGAYSHLDCPIMCAETTLNINETK